jgi:hypothetical protein
MTAISGHCWHCQQPLTETDYSREGECPQCRRQTHVCRNCRFYQPGIHNDCQEPIAEAVVDKTRANFCDYFTPRPQTGAAAAPVRSADDLLSAAEALFKSGDD